jgi:hypothetical protein
MARRGQLEGRLLAVLDPAIDRRPAKKRRKIAAAFTAGAAATALALAGVERAAAAPMPHSIEALAAPASKAVAIKQPAVKKVRRARAKAVATSSSSTSRQTSQHIEDDNGSSTWTSSWSDDKGRSSVFVVRGKVRWSDTATDVAWISPGGSFDLSVHDGSHHWHVAIVPSAEGLTRTLLIDGAQRPWDGQWFAQALEQLDLHSAFAADIRFPQLYREGGAQAVLTYVGRLDGDYARSRYLGLLVGRDPLDESTAVVVFKAVEAMSGDYERSQVLEAAAAKTRLDTDAKRDAFLHACVGIHGDYERSQVLGKLIAQPQLSAELARGVLEATTKMGGSYERSQVLIGLVSRHRTVDALEYLKAANISGDYEHAQVLKALLAAQKLDGPAQLEVIRQARRLSDYEATEVLLALNSSARLTDEARREFQAAADHLSDYSRSRVLAALSR